MFRTRGSRVCAESSRHVNSNSTTLRNRGILRTRMMALSGRYMLSPQDSSTAFCLGSLVLPVRRLGLEVAVRQGLQEGDDLVFLFGRQLEVADDLVLVGRHFRRGPAGHLFSRRARLAARQT